MDSPISHPYIIKKMTRKIIILTIITTLSSCHPQPRQSIAEGPIASLAHVEARIQELRELEGGISPFYYDQVTWAKECPKCRGDWEGQRKYLNQQREEIEELQKKINEREKALSSKLHDPKDGSQPSIKRRFIAAKEIRLQRNKKASRDLASLVLSQQEYWHDEEFRNELYALDSRYNAAAASAKHRMQEKYKKTFEETGKPEADKQLISNGIF
jgi:hypothetical protein